MKLIVHVRPTTACALREDMPDDGAQSLRDIAAEMGGVLEPVHPGSSDPTLAGTWALDVSDASAAARAVERLRAVPAVEAAYVKPADEPPNP